MSATNQFENDLLLLLFNNDTAPSIGDVTGIAGGTVGSVGVSLNTGNTLSETSTSTATAEAAYTNYVQLTAARSSAGWTVAANSVSNTAALTYASSGSGPETETDFGIALDSSGVFLSMYGSLDADLVVNSGVQPEFAIGALAITLD